MKKFAAIFMIALASTTALVGCSGGQPTTEQGGGTTVVEKAALADLLSQMIESGAVRMPMPVDETLAKEAYFIDTEIVEEYAIAETGITPGPGLIVMAKAKDGQVDAVKANMEKLLEAKIGNAFYPEEKDAAESAEIIVDGNYVALFIIHADAKEATINMFKESKK